MRGDFYLGIDVGSTTVKVVVLDRSGELLADTYLRANGQPRGALLRALEAVTPPLDLDRLAGVGLTGSGGAAVAELIGGLHMNELIAQTRAVTEFHPTARTVIEMGGQDSKLLILERDPASGEVLLVDFVMNALCAAGTGSFLDQQAERLGISIEGEFAELALRAAAPARVAGRCTVFAKSDMIHLQQQGTPLPEILAGLCEALARNFKAVIGKGKTFHAPVLFQGGVAYNRAVVRAFESVLGLGEGAIVVPLHHRRMAALGAAMLVRDLNGNGVAEWRGLEPLQRAVHAGEDAAAERLAPLRAPGSPGQWRAVEAGPRGGTWGSTWAPSAPAWR